MEPIDVRHPALPDLFDRSIPNAPMLHAVLEGRVPGRAVADDPDAPTAGAVQTAEGIAFVSAISSQDTFGAALAALRRDAVVGLVWPGAGNRAVEPESPARVTERLGFGPIGSASVALDGLRAGRPPDVTVRPIDAALLARCEWRELVESAHGSAAAFLEHGLGLCLMRDDEILAEAYAPFIGMGVAEVGVVTAEAHRGKGLAAMAVAHLAAGLVERDLAMYWSCDTDNDASARVAGKLGFGDPVPFRLLLYRPLEA